MSRITGAIGDGCPRSRPSFDVSKDLKATQQLRCDPDKMFSHAASILLVDDEPAIHLVVGMFLREAGCFLGDAKDGMEGLRMFKESSWDLVITDRAMPEMGGEQLAEEIRKISADVPLILITGSLTSDIRVDLFDEILPKPFKRVDLLALVGKSLGRKFVGCLH
jgi:two-component system alkaline phosphatase synthesis response regulator PhoP